jgi:hypothetical protein
MAPPAVFLPHLFVKIPVVVTLDQRGHSNRNLRFPPPAHSPIAQSLLRLRLGAVTIPSARKYPATR